MALLPKETRSAASRIVTGTPRFASPRATAMPTGPAPTTTTGSAVSSSGVEGKSEAGYLRGW